MALPRITALVQTHTVTLAEDLDVMFQIVAIPGSKYQAIIDAGRGEDGKTPWEDVAIPLLTEGITHVYSSVESTPVEFTETDATELWEQWPEWARWDVFQAVIAYSTKGPAANPFSRSKPNENDEP